MAYRRKFERSELIKLLKKAHSRQSVPRSWRYANCNSEGNAENGRVDSEGNRVKAHRQICYDQIQRLDQIIDANLNTHWLRDQVMKFLKGEKNELRRWRPKSSLSG